MAPIKTSLLVFAPALVLVFSGCGMMSPSRIKTIQAENRRLSEQGRAQMAEIENLKNHSRKIEDALMRTEQELALYDEQNSIDREKLANLRRERERLRGQVVGPGGRLPLGVEGQLADLARRYPHLHYDPQTGISKLDTDVLFDSGEAELRSGADRMLDEFAAILKTPEASELKVMVVGHTDNQRIKGRETRHKYPNNWHLSAARALAVADRLRAAGLSGERMGIGGFGPEQPIANNDNSPARQQNRRVEIFVTNPEVPIVGMTETLTDLY